MYSHRVLARPHQSVSKSVSKTAPAQAVAAYMEQGVSLDAAGMYL